MKIPGGHNKYRIIAFGGDWYYWNYLELVICNNSFWAASLLKDSASVGLQLYSLCGDIHDSFTYCDVRLMKTGSLRDGMNVSCINTSCIFSFHTSLLRC